MKVEIKKGSVVYADVDVIVNAANENLQAGGGVCGAIFKAAGYDKLQRECDAIGGCKTGHAVLTNGYNLNKHIIHAVGPRYKSDADAIKLKDTFTNSLILADSNNFKSIGIIPISTGIFNYPLDKAAKISINAILSFKAENLEICYIYCFGDNEYNVFTKTLKKLTN